MANSDINIIRQLFAPPSDLSTFNPGKYFSEMEFSDPEMPYNSEDANGLVQLIFFVDYLALKGESSVRKNSILYGDTSFFMTLRTNFNSLEGWHEIEKIIAQQGFIYFTDIVKYFFKFFKPEPPKNRRVG